MVNIQNYINKSFINKYLDNVAFEIRFPSTIRIINDFLDFQEKINLKFPDYGEEYPFPIFSKSMSSEMPQTLRRIVFKDKNDITRIILSINSIGIITKEYKKFNDYKKKITFVIEHFFKSFKISSISRVGLRYVNKYPLRGSLDDSLQIIKEKFNLIFNNDLIPFNKIISHNIEIRKRIDNEINITFRSILQKEPLLKQYIYILDFDTYILGEFSPKEYIDLLKRLRIAEKKEFLKFITEDFISEMEFID
ncbi:MAG: TIGR04255 family protein [Promethearchaeota archaeon]